MPRCPLTVATPAAGGSRGQGMGGAPVRGRTVGARHALSAVGVPAMPLHPLAVATAAAAVGRDQPTARAEDAAVTAGPTGALAAAPAAAEVANAPLRTAPLWARIIPAGIIGDGICIRMAPAYPGVRTGSWIGNGRAFAFTATTTVHYRQSGRTSVIIFYQLADGRGWMHDFDERKPDHRTIVPCDERCPDFNHCTAQTGLRELQRLNYHVGDFVIASGLIEDYVGDVAVIETKGPDLSLGWDRAIFESGGDDLTRARRSIGYIPVGEARILPSYDHSNTRSIVLARGPECALKSPLSDFTLEDTDLRSAYAASLECGHSRGADSFGLYLFSAGALRANRSMYDLACVSLRALFDAALKFELGKIKEIWIIARSPGEQDALLQAAADLEGIEYGINDEQGFDEKGSVDL